MNSSNAVSSRRTSETTSLDEPHPVPETSPECDEKHSPTTADGGGHLDEYLTFETVLPAYVTSPQLSGGLSSPNLKKYASPFDWSSSHKTTILILSCAITFLAGYSAGAYSLASGPLRAKWGLSEVAFNTGVTTWAIGFAASPMVLAPFSEITGRRPVFVGSGIIFLVAMIGCALTDHFAGMLVARFFVGAGASTFATMVGGVISDIYHAQDRNTPMAIYSGSALAGTGMGPMISAFIVHHTSWRWVFYVQVISVGIMMVAVTIFFKETRGSVLLSRKAKVLNKYLEQLEQQQQQQQQSSDKSPNIRPSIRYKVATDENRASLSRLIYLSLTIPFRLLATEPVVFFFSLWIAFAWALLYMTFSIIPLVFTTNHGFRVQQTGAVFAAVTIGSIIATILSIAQEKMAKRYWPKLTTNPEGRLYFACLESALLPIGLFWFGWTSYRSIPWISPVLALGCAQIGIFSIYLAVFNYLADVYHRYASSALAGQSFCRNVLAAVFPLFTSTMYRRLGFPGASSLLGGVAALLTLVPWVLVFNGEKIRAKSRIAREIMQLD